MSEVIKVLTTNNTEEETWSWVARDALLDAWTALLLVSIQTQYDLYERIFLDMFVCHAFIGLMVKCNAN